MSDTAMQTMEQISPEQSRELNGILDRFLDAYGDKAQGQTDEAWLQQRLQIELPELGAETAGLYSRTIVTTIQSYDRDLASLKEATRRQKTFREWFFRHTRQVCADMTDSEYASKMLVLHTEMEQITGTKSAEGAAFPDANQVAQMELTGAEVRALAGMTGRQVELAGMQRVVEVSEYIERLEDGGQEHAVVSQALETGEKAGLKTAVAGALTTASYQRVVQVVSTSAPVEVCADLACMTVENAQTSVDLAKKNITAQEAVDQKVANAAAFVTRMGIGAIRSTINRTVGKVPVIGPAIRELNCLVTGMVEKKVSEKVAEKVKRANGPVAVLAKKAAAKVSDGIKAGAAKVQAVAKSFASKLSKLAGLVRR